MSVASPTTVEPIVCYHCPGSAEVLLVAVAMPLPPGKQDKPQVFGEGMTGMPFNFGEPSSSFKVSLVASLRRKYILG